ncbi:hypothetical protein DPEC_G00017640 [Dallia pectoralis]|uniref:Uncharacterized protein n=1 Tax=Dallia pectoralis TaxID=75939 RepID=A0ACC2HFW4_DALPE|nr:hypothetical protein DPEC_G00017640 [Dallia pectoralis]
MESLKGTTRGEDLCDKVSGVIERMKLHWCKPANVTTDGSPNLTGKNVGLLKRIQDKVKEENPELDTKVLPDMTGRNAPHHPSGTVSWVGPTNQTQMVSLQK